MVLNAVLAPVLIAGVGTGRPMGVAGAGLASSIAVVAGVVMMFIYFERLEKFVRFDPHLFRPRLDAWKRILKIGLPAGGEFAPDVRLHGRRVLDHSRLRRRGAGGLRPWWPRYAGDLPSGHGGGVCGCARRGTELRRRPLHDRTRKTFGTAAMLGTGLMLALLIVCLQVEAEAMVRFFTQDAAVASVAAGFLHIISWNFVATGVIFTCSSMFQALGNTVPSVISSATRIATFGIPGAVAVDTPGLPDPPHLDAVGGTVAVQLVVSLLLLRREFRKRLAPPTPELSPSPASA